MQRLRLYACLVRAAGVSAMREIEREIELPTPSAAQLRALVGPFVATCSAVAGALRSLIDETAALPLPEEARIAARWTDEDVSMVLETLCATLGIAIENRARAVPALRGYAEPLADHAVEQARHRRERGYDSLGSADASERDIEHLEFRRHVLKRFTSSVLWLSLEVHEAAAWVVHTLYAFAAAVAMAFALAAGFRATPMTESFFRYAVVVVIAYAVKDRLKAFLQSVFAGWIARRFPDRKWAILDRERGRRVGNVHERAAFLPSAASRPRCSPSAAARASTRWRSTPAPSACSGTTRRVSIAAGQKGAGSGDFPMMTEIFRLNLRRWLSHTDDPNRKIVFADPEDARVYSATARRVYNVNVVYRLSTSGSDSPWHRLRMVVSRKGSSASTRSAEPLQSLAEIRPDSSVSYGEATCLPAPRKFLPQGPTHPASSLADKRPASSGARRSLSGSPRAGPRRRRPRCGRRGGRRARGRGPRDRW